jgi:hypothetical protein
MRLWLLFVIGCGFSEVKSGSDLSGADFSLPPGLDLAGVDLAQPAGGHKRVFTTSTVVPANFNGTGGLLAADLVCNTAAGSLGGTWRAWLSDSSTNAIDRILSDGPWYRIDGPMAFANHAALGVGPSVPLTITETLGTANDIYSVWTGTDFDGTGWIDTMLGTGNCDEWTSGNDPNRYGRIGDSTHTDPGWTSQEDTPCVGVGHLYCFESD